MSAVIKHEPENRFPTDSMVAILKNQNDVITTALFVRLPSTMKFGRQMQNDKPMTTHRSKSKT